MTTEEAGVYTIAKLEEVAAKLGGRSCLAVGLNVSHTAIWKWYENQRVPLTSLADFLALADAAGVEVSPALLRPDFFTPELLAAL